MDVGAVGSFTRLGWPEEQVHSIIRRGPASWNETGIACYGPGPTSARMGLGSDSWPAYPISEGLDEL